MSSLKIPSDIRDIIDSSSGKEPVAFVDIFEERGDFDVIDTQNQFIAINDNANSQDLNVDFDRKPGFAVLAPGKRVDSIDISILKEWGSGTVDWSGVGGLPNFSNGLAMIGSAVNSVPGNDIIVAIMSGMTNTFQIYTAKLLSTDNGKNYVVTGLLNNNFFAEVTAETALENFTNFDQVIAVTRRNSFGNCYIYPRGSQLHTEFILNTTTINSVARRTCAAKINGKYFYGLKWRDGSVGIDSAAIVVSDDEVATPGFSTTYSFPLIGADYVDSICFINNKIIISIIRNNPQKTVDIYSSVFSGTHSAYSFTKISTHDKVSGGPTLSRLRVISGSVCLFAVSTRNITNGDSYLYSNDDGVTFTPRFTPAFYTTIESNGFDKGSMVVSGNLQDVFETTDGINWITYAGVTPNFFTTNTGSTSILPFIVKDKASGDISVFRRNQAVSNNHPPAGLATTNSFEYDVIVEDVYVVDSGKGKK